MNQSHANEMSAAFPKIRKRTKADLIIGVFYGTTARLNNKPALVEANTGPYVSALVGKEFWEFVTGVENAHKEIFRAIQEAQARFAKRHGGQTFFEQLIQARLGLSQSFREAFKLEGEETDMWEQIFDESF